MVFASNLQAFDRHFLRQDQNPGGAWEDWIKSAYQQRINLNALGYFDSTGVDFDFIKNSGVRCPAEFGFGVKCFLKIIFGPMPSFLFCNTQTIRIKSFTLGRALLCFSPKIRDSNPNIIFLNRMQ
jgi:hypothetical protein